MLCFDSASIWNGLCLLYLLVFPHIDPVTGETLSPKSGFVYILLALCTLPLIIGMCAGGEAMWGQRDEERQRRERRTRLQKFAVSFGFLSKLFRDSNIPDSMLISRMCRRLLRGNRRNRSLYRSRAKLLVASRSHDHCL
jgi:hypothetical protein